MSWISRIANAFQPARTAAGLDDELQFHLDQRIDDLVRGGMPRREAELLARRQLGNRLNAPRVQLRSEVRRLARLSPARLPLRPAHARANIAPRAWPPLRPWLSPSALARPRSP